jgi:colanic acid/amylovoran biosynthesis glycosyltransferase
LSAPLTANGGSGLKVAYLVNQYPKVSHSFIRREILALERQGVEVLRVSIRGWDAELIGPEDLHERQQTRYALQGGAIALIRAALRSTLTTPLGLLKALCLAVKMSRNSDRPWPYHLAYLAEACRIIPWLQKFGATHLHAHFGTNSAEVAMLAQALCGLPYSFTVHGPDEFDNPMSIGLGEKIRRAKFVVAISSFGRSQLMRWVEQDHWPKLKVVHCGLERAFHDVPHSPIPERPQLVCVGRLNAQKGQLILVEAAAMVARDGIPFELVFAGDGEMRPQIEAGIARHGLTRHVRITGWISGEQVRNEILAARALVLPSFAEGLPVVIMEAMALRRPVLTTYVAGIPELVIDGENGWLVPAGDAAALAVAMKACLAAPAHTLLEMGNRGHERAVARHNVDTEAAKLAALFREHE